MDSQKANKELRRLKQENTRLRLMVENTFNEQIQRWRRLCSQSDCSSDTLTALLGEFVTTLRVESASLYILNNMENYYHHAVSYPQDYSGKYILQDSRTKIRKTLELGKIAVTTIDNLVPAPDSLTINDAQRRAKHILVPVFSGSLNAVFKISIDGNVTRWDAYEADFFRQVAAIVYRGYLQVDELDVDKMIAKSEQLLLSASSVKGLESCFHDFSHQLNVERISFYVTNSEPNALELVCSYPTSETFNRFNASSDTLSASSALYAELLEGHPLLLSSINENADFSYRFDADSIDEYKVLAVPLIYNRRLVALLGFYAGSGREVWLSRKIKFAKVILPLLYSTYQQQVFRYERQNSVNTLKMVLDTTNAGYSLISRSAPESYFNAFVIKRLGYSEEQLSDVRWARDHVFWNREHRRRSDRLFITALKNRVARETLMLRSRSDEKCYFTCTFSPFNYDESLEVSTVMVSYSDVTELVRKQAELEEARLEADSANVAKSEFLARMSHEIRTPMNAILGMAHLLQDSQLDREQHSRLQNIDKAAQHLMGVINDILDFSKIESGLLELEKTEFDLQQLLEQVMNVSAFHNHSGAQELILDVGDNVPAQIVGDPLRLTQILTNLLSNAVKFTEQGNIVLRVKNEQDQRLQFQVEDSGVGMAAEQLDYLFEPFTQADGSISRRYGGTGLGLSIVKNLVELQGGDIQVSSKLEHGSCFTFTLPLNKSANPPATLPPKLNVQKALLLDDNPQARAVIAAYLRRFISCVDEVETGAQAMAMLAEAESQSTPGYDLLLMDYRLPDANGLQLAETIREKITRPPKVLVMVSAHQREDVLRESSVDVASHLINKPLSPQRLRDSVSEVFGIKTAQPLQPKNKSYELQGVRVLLVEDNVVNQQIATALLAKQQVLVSVAGDGQQCVELLSRDSQAFDMVLMDLEMPNVDGFQATMIIREDLALDIPIIAMTAHAQGADQQRALSVGMNSYLTKPINPELLYQTLETYQPVAKVIP